MGTNSDAERAGLNVTLQPIEGFLYAGFQERFFEKFQQVPCTWSSSTDEAKVIDALFKDGLKKYPYALFSVDSFNLATDRGSRKHGSFYGGLVMTGTNNKHAYKVNFIPVDFQCSFAYVTNNFIEVQSFANTWMFATSLGWLNFSVTYGMTNFDIKVLSGETLSIPKREADLSNVQEYRVQGEFRMLGFMSMPQALERGMVDRINVDLVHDDGSNSRTVPDDPSRVMWSFPKNLWDQKTD